MSPTQCSSQNSDCSVSARQSVLKEIHSCVSSANRWYRRLCYVANDWFDDLSNRRSVDDVQQLT